MPDQSPECPLTLTADDRRTWFDVYNGNLWLVASGSGGLTLSLPAGLYEVHSERGGRRAVEILKLKAGRPVEHHVAGSAGPVLLPIPSCLRPEEASHAAAMARATTAIRSWWLLGRRRARIVVMLRQPTGVKPACPIAEQAKFISLLDPARRTVRKFSNRWDLDERDGYAITHANVAPGCYTLRVADSAGVTEQSVVAMPARQTIVVAPVFMDGPQPGLATITMCHARESWNSVTEEHLLWSETIFSRLRRGRLPMTKKEAESAGKFFDSDPLLAIAAANSLTHDVAANPPTEADLDGPGATGGELVPDAVPDHERVSGADAQPRRGLERAGNRLDVRHDLPNEYPGQIIQELLDMLSRSSAQHPDVKMLLQAAKRPSMPVKYPPMFTDTYVSAVAALHADGRNGNIVSEGSYAENACAVAFQGGVFLRWPAGAIASIALSPAKTKAPTALPDRNSFTRSAVESLFRRSTGQTVMQWLVTALVALLTRTPLIKRWLTGLMSIKAGWESGNIRRIAAEKVILYGQQVAALRRGSTALTLTRITDQGLADGSGVPTSISGRIRDHLVAHLGGEMTEEITDEPRPIAASQTGSMIASTDGSRPLPVLIAAIAVLVAFGVLVGWMLITAKTTNGILWDRQLYIYTSVEAIVFAAAGALFGLEVKRQQVTGAERRADASADRAAEALKSERLAATEAERARALAAATRGAIAASRDAAAADSQAADVPGAARSPAGGRAAPDVALTALGNIADELFPPTPT
jgi:F0F1-type ATP synthase membrane subunit b/b'